MTTKNIDFWLNEKELKTPEHDEIVIWTFNNTEKILSELKLMPEQKYSCYSGWKECGNWDWDSKKYLLKIDCINQNDAIVRKKIIEEEFIDFEKKKIEIIKTIEYSIPNVYNLGFIDLACFIKIPHFPFFNFLDENKKELEDVNFYFEIKPTIKSIGEVIRQINYYRKIIKEKNATFIIVTKTTGLKDIFNSQNIYIYEYKKEEQNDLQR